MTHTIRTSEILKRARNIIAVPQRWTQHTYAQDKNGNTAFYADAKASCWCATGAIRLACFQLRVDAARDCIRALEQAIAAGFPQVPEGMSISAASFNDSHTHEEVLAMVDRAIAWEEVQGR